MQQILRTISKTLLAPLFAAMLLCACSPSVKVVRNQFKLPKDALISNANVGKYGGIFVLPIFGEPKTFNPLTITDAYSAFAVGCTTGRLVDYDPIADKIVPALAKSWQVLPDNKTYIFNLREGVKFSDGAPFSADDVIFTLDCIFAPKLDKNGKAEKDPKTGKALLRYPTRNAGQYTIGGEYVKYKKIDDYTVEFKTNTVYAPFINDISYLEILPKHKLLKAFENGTLTLSWTSQTAIESPSEIVGLGAFKIYSYRPGERLVLEPNPHYWKADKKLQRLPYIDFLIFKFVSDANTATVLFATGQSDAANVSANDYVWVKNFASTYNFDIYERGPDSGIQFLCFNQNMRAALKENSALKSYKVNWFCNKLFRQAVLYAINRRDLINGTFFGRAKEIDSVIGQTNKKWHNPNLKKYNYNPKLAKELLLKAGFIYKDNELFDKQGHRVEFSLMISDGSLSAMNTATTIMENLKAVGIAVKLTAMDFSAMISKINDSCDFEAVMLGFTGGGDPSGGKAIYRSDGFLHIWNPRQDKPQTEWEKQIDTLMDQQESEMDLQKRRDIVFKMQEIFTEQLPLIYLTTPFSYSGVKKKWKNISVPQSESILWNLDELYQDD